MNDKFIVRLEYNDGQGAAYMAPSGCHKTGLLVTQRDRATLLDKAEVDYELSNAQYYLGRMYFERVE